MKSKRPRRLEQEVIQEHFGYGLGSPETSQTQDGAAAPIRITRITHDGELLFVLPDSDRHERRIQRAVLSASDRLFWITVTVACGSPGRARGRRSKSVKSLAKRYGHIYPRRETI